MTDAALFAPPAAAPAAQACAHCGESLRGATDALFCCAGCASAHAIIGAAGLGSFYRRLEERHAHRPVPLDTDFAGYARPAGTGEAELDLLVDGLDCAGLRLADREPAGAQSRDHRARASISRRDACRCAGAARPARPTAMSVWWRRSASAWRPTTSSPPRPTTTARRASCCAAWRSQASPPPTSCCCRSPSGPATTDRWATPRAPSSTGCPPRSPCRRSPMPAGRSSARPSPRCAAGRTNMDVPISIGVTLACIVSLHETVGRRAARLLRFGDHAAVLPADRPLSRPPRARPGTPRRARPAGAGQPAARTVAGARRHGRLASGSTGWRRATRCWWRAGERIGADGIVSDGRSALDAALISGESVPRVGRARRQGVRRHGQSRRADPRARRPPPASTRCWPRSCAWSRRPSAAARASSRIADRVARAYAPVVHVTALLTFLGWMLLGGLAWDRALLIATAVLIITCPCALALAVPVVQVVASHAAAARGRPAARRRPRSSAWREVDHVVFDKTGTLTLGRPELVEAGADTRGAARWPPASPPTRAIRWPRPWSRAAPDAAPADGRRRACRPGPAARRRSVWARPASAASPTRPTTAGPELWLARPGARARALRLRRSAAARCGGRRRRARRAAASRVELLSGDRPAAVARAAAEAGIDRLARRGARRPPRPRASPSLARGKAGTC